MTIMLLTLKQEALFTVIGPIRGEEFRQNGGKIHGTRQEKYGYIHRV